MPWLLDQSLLLLKSQSAFCLLLCCSTLYSFWSPFSYTTPVHVSWLTLRFALQTTEENKLCNQNPPSRGCLQEERWWQGHHGECQMSAPCLQLKGLKWLQGWAACSNRLAGDCFGCLCSGVHGGNHAGSLSWENLGISQLGSPLQAAQITTVQHKLKSLHLLTKTKY